MINFIDVVMTKHIRDLMCPIVHSEIIDILLAG